MTAEDWAQFLFSSIYLKKCLWLPKMTMKEVSAGVCLHEASEIEGQTSNLFLWKWNLNFLSQIVRTILAS